MSKENVKLFYEALAKDQALQEKLKGLGQKYEGQKPDEARTELIYQKEVVPLAGEAGLDFTLDEVKEYVAEMKKPRELSEEELEAVAGGVVTCACIFGGGGDWHGITSCSCVLGGYGGMGPDAFICVVGGGGGASY